MKDNLKRFVARLLSLKNIVPLLVITFAFVGTFLPQPFGLQSEQIVIALLALLAIDSLIERIGVLTGIKEDVRELRELADSQSARRTFLGFRKDLPRIDQVISRAETEIWVSGVTLGSVATLTPLFQEGASQGVRVRFLAVTPSEASVEELVRYFGFGRDLAEAYGMSNLTAIYHRLVRQFPKNVELRATVHRPANGYLIIDPNTDHGHMNVTPYLYQVEDSQWTPVLTLSKRTDPRSFQGFLDDFVRLWQSATKWIPDDSETELVGQS